MIDLKTRTFIDLFEKDAQMLKKFSKAFVSSFQKVINAQSMMVSASQELSYYLRLYGKQNFPLDPAMSAGDSSVEDDSLPATTLNQFAGHIDEVFLSKQKFLFLGWIQRFYLCRSRRHFKC
jgi:hypothetical protein